MGKILTYEGKAINALYHSTCGGFTEDSQKVFTSEKPYLKSVECNYCEHSSHLTQKVEIPIAKVKSIIDSEMEINLNNPHQEISIIKRK